MNDIDFLPTEYRQKHERRQSQPWQIVVGAAILGLLTAAATAQHLRRHRAERELAAVSPVYQKAVDMKNQLAELQKRLQEARAKAELYTYLRHPWPRSRILAALAESLPDEIAFEEVCISLQPPDAARPREEVKPVDRNAEAARVKSLAPAARDLLNLRRRVDALQTVVSLTGEVSESSTLHRYLGDMDALEWFEKAELDSLTGSDEGRGSKPLRFHAMLIVQPGYGQPGGPVGPPGSGAPCRTTSQVPQTARSGQP